jgi:hypothetical protein
LSAEVVPGSGVERLGRTVPGVIRQIVKRGTAIGGGVLLASTIDGPVSVSLDLESAPYWSAILPTARPKMAFASSTGGVGLGERRRPGR